MQTNPKVYPQRRQWLVGCGLAALVAGLAPMSAVAQDAGAVEEIIVTAQRRAESVQEIPASITAVGAEAMAQRGITDVATLQFAAPSLTIGRNLGNAQIAIRGVGRSVGQPGVSVNIDGVYQPRNAPMVASQADLTRIEVLRGPQGTLYGRNANAGAVNFVTGAPTDVLEGSVLAGYAQYAEQRLQVVANVPINDALRTRLVLDYNAREEGFVENVVPGGADLDKMRSLSGRLRVAADISEVLTADLSFTAFRATGASDYYVLTSPPSAAGVRLNPFVANAIVPLDPWRTSAMGAAGSEREFTAASATLDWRLPFGSLKSITAFQRLVNDWDMDRDGTNLAVVDTRADEASTTFSQEFDLTGSTGPVDWVGGLYYFADRTEVTSFYAFRLGFAPLPVNSFLVHDMPRSDTDAYAAFADATWRVTPSLKLIAGARYSQDRLTVLHRNSIGTFVANRPVTTVFTCPLQKDDITSDAITHRLGAQYDLSGGRNVYATVSTGFKSGGVNFTSCNNTYKPEFITSYEAGFKGRFLGNSLTLNASAFYYDYTDFQLSQVVGIASRITNAASATIKGLELESNWAPDAHWSANASLTLLDATYGAFTNVDSLNAAAGVQNLEGRRLNSAPKVSANLGLAYRTDMTPGGRLTARADVGARSKVYFREFNSPLDAQKGYAVVNANLIWDSPEETYSVRVYGANLTNQDYFTAMLAVDGFGARAGSFGAPRQVGVEVRARF